MPSGGAERLSGDVEDRMGDAREAVAGDPEAGEPLDRARGVDDDAVDRAEDVQPRVELSLPTRDDVVGGEHRPRFAASFRTQRASTLGRGSHWRWTTSGFRDAIRPRKRRTLGPYSTAFRGRRSGERGKRRVSLDESGRKSSWRR